MTDDTSENTYDRLPWPEKGDVLFTIGEDWWNNACLNYSHDDWEFYATGYRKAAEILVEKVKETQRHQDILVFPIVFLYRQHLELRLKEIIRSSNELLNDNRDFPRTHELGTLWKMCRPMLAKLEPRGPKQDLEAIDEAINQFCAIDPTSQAFRYPVMGNGVKALASDVKYINLRQLSEVMERIANFFDSVAMMVSTYVDYKRDMEREFREDYR